MIGTRLSKATLKLVDTIARRRTDCDVVKAWPRSPVATVAKPAVTIASCAMPTSRTSPSTPGC